MEFGLKVAPSSTVVREGAVEMQEIGVLAKIITKSLVVDKRGVYEYQLQ